MAENTTMQRAQAGAVPEFSHVAQRKLQALLDRGYRITGYALEKPQEGAPPDRGFIDHGGFVGWWRGEGQEQSQPRAVARMDCPVCKGDSGFFVCGRGGEAIVKTCPQCDGIEAHRLALAKGLG